MLSSAVAMLKRGDCVGRVNAVGFEERMSMNTRTEPLENRQLSLTVEVDQERVDKELRKAARKVGSQYRIPGFRRGKAPYSIVVQYVGLPNLYSEFIDSLGDEIYAQALEQEKIEPYAMASADIPSLEPLTYHFQIPLEPTVDLGDYRSIRIEEEEPEVTEEEIDEVLQEYRAEFAGWTEVDRPAEYGDMLTIDIRSVLIDEDATEENSDAEGEEGETEDETVVLDETDWDVTLDEENPMEPPGLDQELLGMSPDEEKEFVLSWPEDSQSIYAGKEAQFHVKLHTVQANMEPELDDEFAKKVDEEFETLEDLKEDIFESILDEKQVQAERDYLDKAVEALVEMAEMDYPPVVVEDQIDSMVSEFSRQLRMYGIENLEAYLNQTGQSMEEYRESLREQAEIAARRSLVISELYQQEGITVSDEEIEERIQQMVEDFGGEDASEEQAEVAEMLAENMRSGSGRPILESQIIQEKSLERLLAIARGEELPEPGAPRAEEEAELAETSEEIEADPVATDTVATDTVAADASPPEAESVAQVEASDETKQDHADSADSEKSDSETSESIADEQEDEPEKK